MQNTPHDKLDVVAALVPQNITSATTVTGPAIDTKGCREHLLVIQLGAYTAGSLTACNVQLFTGDKNDLSDEAQAGSNVNIFASIAANATLFIRMKTEDYKRFARCKVVTTGAPTALNIACIAVATTTPDAGALLTLTGTI